jgi:hypothetical protein
MDNPNKFSMAILPASKSDAYNSLSAEILEDNMI